MNGLTSKQAAELQQKYGKNELNAKKNQSLLSHIFHTITEPTILLLFIAASLYLILGESSDGIIMFISIIVIVVIDIFQEYRTDKTLRALKELSSPKVAVLRDGKKIDLPSSELVPGDIIFVHEGLKIPADGTILENNGLSIDESSLTGESGPIWKSTENTNKNDYWQENYCYQGTLVLQGSGVIEVKKTGTNTEYGKISAKISEIKPSRTNLQKQVNKIVKISAVFAFTLFLIVTILSFINASEVEFVDRAVQSLLAGLAIALAMIPEEFPIILTVFLSLGAWRLAKKDSVVRRLPKVEVLGAITTLCVDKTGTITKNQMRIIDINSQIDKKTMLEYMCLCSEEHPYDPMEKAIFEYAKNLKINKKQLFEKQKIKDFPFSNTAKIVGRAWQIDDKKLIVCKGSPESILKLCKLPKQELTEINNKLKKMQEQGLRVIACAYNPNAKISAKINEKISNFDFKFAGFIGLIDPPREHIKSYVEKCHNAGIRTIMITGDNGTTASSIAKKIGIKNTDNIITGETLDRMTDEELTQAVKTVAIFSRVIPEHKFRIVKALQRNGEVVAMTGDGVNDAPALKQADIGIAMGGRGSEVAREASDLILIDDNFKTIVETVEDGRRIYSNIKKAIEYVIIIHTPIALSALFAPLMGIEAELLFLLPPQIVLFELIVDPTCSVILERQPAESNVMQKPPRNLKSSILNLKSLILSIIQGLAIFAVSFCSYLSFLPLGANLARTIGLLIILISSIFLVFVYASKQDFAYKTFKNLIHDKVVFWVNLILIIFILIIIYSPLNGIFKMSPLNIYEIAYTIIAAFLAVFWFEIVKLIKYLKSKNRNKHSHHT